MCPGRRRALRPFSGRAQALEGTWSQPPQRCFHDFNLNKIIERKSEFNMLVSVCHILARERVVS